MLFVSESSAGMKTSLETALATQYELKCQLEQLQTTIRSRDKQIEALVSAKQQVSSLQLRISIGNG